MSFDKNYPNRKDRRKPYRKSKAFDRSCRNHGSCGWCAGNRLYSRRRAEEGAQIEDGLREYEEEERESLSIELKKLIKNMRKTDFTGERVIVRGNKGVDDYLPLRVGRCIGYRKIANTKVPVILRDDGEERAVLGGFIFPYSEELENYLKQYNDEEQWKMLEKIYYQLEEQGESQDV